MNFREQQEQKEKEYLSPYASLSSTATRANPEPKDEVRTEYQRDRDRIIHSKSFMRLADKTQVFFHPGNDHVSTRLFHSMNVSQIARTIARALKLNEDLAEAVGLGHDLGHTPFGHSGEAVLDKLMQEGFDHAENSVRISDLEGLNLTLEVKNGICHHGTNQMAKTLEGQCVKFADKIAYITHDFDDAIRLGKAPKDFNISQFGLGDTYSQMINTLTLAVIEASLGKNVIEMQEDVFEKMRKAREYEFKVIIKNDAGPRDSSAQEVITTLFEHYKSEGKTDQQACDYISGMTDAFALNEYKQVISNS